MNIAPHIEHTRLNAAITEKDIDGLIREAVEYNFPAGMKASGGIKTYEQAVALINPGADHIGTSTGVGIIMQSIYKS